MSANALQRKIFTRWVNQKLGLHRPPIDDVVTGLQSGDPLISLMEVLSETPYPGWKKVKKGTTQRIQMVENCNNALSFCWTCGVEMKMKPSAENLVEGVEQQVLGLIWAIMMKYMRLDDDEDEDGPPMKFEDALRMWVQNQVEEFGINVPNMGKAFHDGYAFCALIHKFRPKLIDFASCKPGDTEENLKKAFAAADKYFGLEQYLEISDIPKLDVKSMTVFVSEFYYGISAQRKVDLAARRITKLVAFTKENDAIKEEYAASSADLRARFTKVFEVLNDTTIDNTMAGARARLETFNQYIKNDKGPITKKNFELQERYTHLARRLESHKRPPFTPAEGCSVTELQASLEEMEKKEGERKVALHAELNRQIKLAKIFEQYTKKFEAIQALLAEKKAYLSEETNIKSVGEAKFALNTLDAYFAEYDTLAKTTVPSQNASAKELLDEKFEHSEKVTECEATVTAGCQECESLSATKKALHEDDLAREEYKEKIRGVNADHVAAHAKLEHFIVEKKASLEKKEDVKSIADAELHLSLLQAYENEKSLFTGNIEPFKALGKQVLEAKYETALSQWVFEDPDSVKAREEFVDKSWAELDDLSAKKKAVLEDDLARENFKEDVRKKNMAHKAKHAELTEWAGKSDAYLETKEPVDSVPEAQDNLAVMLTYLADQSAKQASDVQALSALGQEILTAHYKTDLSEYKFETPDEVTDREKAIADAFTSLEAKAAAKKAVLEDDLAREQYRFRVHLWAEQHISSHGKLQTWISEEEAYFAVKEAVDSIADAEGNLKTLANHKADKVDVTKVTKAGFDKLTKDILEAAYSSDLSQWKYEKPDEVTGRQTFVDSAWEALDKAAADKQAVLDDDLKRELRKEELRVQYAKEASGFTAYAKDTVNVAKSTMFGFVLEEVEAFEAVLAGMDAEITKRAEESKATYEKVYAEMTELGVRHAENPYTKLTPEDLGASQAALAAALAERKAAFDKELAKQRADDALCKEFAGMADPFCKTIADNKATVDGFKEDLAGAVATIKKFLEEKAQLDETLPKLQGLQGQMDEAGILYNRYTLVNAVDAAGQLEMYALFMPSKLKAFEAELEYQELRGVTREQYAEMEKQFKTFDKDNSGKLDKKEFKACLYSMGEERGKKEVAELMAKYGTGEGKEQHITYESYVEFMIGQLGDTDTMEEVITGFGLINRGKEECDDELMANVLEQPEIDFIKSTHGSDYKAWAESVFSR